MARTTMREAASPTNEEYGKTSMAPNPSHSSVLRISPRRSVLCTIANFPFELTRLAQASIQSARGLSSNLAVARDLFGGGRPLWYGGFVRTKSKVCPLSHALGLKISSVRAVNLSGVPHAFMASFEISTPRATAFLFRASILRATVPGPQPASSRRIFLSELAEAASKRESVDAFA